MKAYIGNKILCLAQPEERDGVEGYMAIYPDGSETFLVKEIFEFEFREMEDEEIDLIIDSVNSDLTHEDIKNLASMSEEDWEDTFDLTGEATFGNPNVLKEYKANPDDFEVTETEISASEVVERMEEE